MVTIDESYALIHAEAYPGSFVRITIRDTGIGMDVEEIAHVFEPFYRERHDGGEGLGLAVAYGIVMQHGGWIEVESSSGHGSSFSIYLPASSREAASLPGASGTDGLQGHGERILLVEDEEAVRATIERMLRDNGYIVLTAADAEQAYDIFVSHAGNIHLVFSDVVLPGESGVELVEQLRLHKNGLPVILSSGYTDRDQDLDTIRKRDYRFLQKPFSLPDLLKTVREVMDPVSMS